MYDVVGTPSNENDVSIGIIETSGIFGVVLDLDTETESISTRIFQIKRCVIHSGAIEGRLRATGIGDGKRVRGEGVQGSTWILEEFERLAPIVDDGRGDLQVPQSVDVNVGGRSLDGNSGSVGDSGGSRDSDRGGDEGNEGSTEGRGEHRGEGSERGGGVEEETPIKLWGRTSLV